MLSSLPWMALLPFSFLTSHATAPAMLVSRGILPPSVNFRYSLLLIVYHFSPCLGFPSVSTLSSTAPLDPKFSSRHPFGVMVQMCFYRISIVISFVGSPPPSVMNDLHFLSSMEVCLSFLSFLMISFSFTFLALFHVSDNCARENKNQWIFRFASFLVRINLFREVQIRHLIKGHTHEDIDQVFFFLFLLKT